MAAEVLLSDVLADALPKGLQLRVYHISTRPASVPALYSPPLHKAEQETFCESHLLSIALPQIDRSHEILVFAIEILIFTTESLTTVFVSKADTTGFLDLLNLERSLGSVVKTLTTAFVRFLVAPRLKGPRVVLSLFARSQNQYLFPGSVEYTGKHVLDDRQLIKWWCRIIDLLLADSKPGVDQAVAGTTAYLVVPGCDQSETRAFFPTSARQGPLETSRWQASYPAKLLASDDTAPLRCLIPRLPDDPKSRFLTDLDDSKDDEGQWRSVRSMAQFWELMSYRQECSAGRLVGFIWVIFGEHVTIPEQDSTTGSRSDVPQNQLGTMTTTLPTPGQSQVTDADVDQLVDTMPAVAGNDVLPGSPPPSSPDFPAKEANVGELGDAEAGVSDQYYDEGRTLAVTWPMQTRGELIVSSEQYDILVEYLLRLDFSTRSEAETGTSRFLAKAVELSGNDWGRSVTGRKVHLESIEVASMPQENGVNILIGVRKKRKVDETASIKGPPVNTLGAGLVRKKAKTQVLL